MELPGKCCPAQFDVVYNDDDLHVCSLNTQYHSLKLQYKREQPFLAVNIFTGDNNNLELTEDSPLTINDTCNLSHCCFVITIFNSLSQFHIF
ncbi:unnamed protein product [Schistosoma turkestanicum]|nr:unnamed protein product [Schistosoma turkestanicum]